MLEFCGSLQFPVLLYGQQRKPEGVAFCGNVPGRFGMEVLSEPDLCQVWYKSAENHRENPEYSTKSTEKPEKKVEI